MSPLYFINSGGPSYRIPLYQITSPAGLSLAEIEAKLLPPVISARPRSLPAVYHTGIYQPADFIESSYNANHLLIYKVQAGQLTPLYHLERVLPHRISQRLCRSQPEFGLV